MTHGSLFSGIGGFDLAAEWMGWDNLFHCEWNPFGQKVLKYYWPNAVSYEDITKTDFTIWRGRIDVLTGGFPCQPYSLAGKRKGKDDERHLWPEMLRAIREIRPTWVVGENAFGLVNWNGGLVFDEVQTDLEAEGYEVQPYVLLACAINAPHRRDRIWFVAKNTDCNGWRGVERKEKTDKWKQRNTCTRDNERLRANDAEIRIAANANGNPTRTPTKSRRIEENGSNSQHEINAGEGGQYAFGNIEQMGRDVTYGESESSSRELQQQSGERQFGGCDSKDNAANTGDTRLEGSKVRRSIGRSRSKSHELTSRCFCTDWSQFPTQSPICTGDDGISSRLDSITFPKWRKESIKAAGNAVVPQVVFQIFKSINSYVTIYG